MRGIGLVGEVPQACERLIPGATRGDHAPFTITDCIGRPRRVPTPPPAVPQARRLPFGRSWRAPNPAGA